MLSVSIPAREQEYDQRTFQHHVSPGAYSDLLYKNSLYDNAKTIFSGLIFVDEGAHHTDAYQTCRNLLMSDTCEANSMPGLEINADQVKCSHGSTSSQIQRRRDLLPARPRHRSRHAPASSSPAASRSRSSSASATKPPRNWSSASSTTSSPTSPPAGRECRRPPRSRKGLHRVLPTLLPRPWALETTLILFKPDAIAKHITGTVLARFQDAGFTIRGIKMMKLSDEILAEHYSHIADRPSSPPSANSCRKPRSSPPPSKAMT